MSQQSSQCFNFLQHSLLAKSNLLITEMSRRLCTYLCYYFPPLWIEIIAKRSGAREGGIDDAKVVVS